MSEHSACRTSCSSKRATIRGSTDTDTDLLGVGRGHVGTRGSDGRVLLNMGSEAASVSPGGLRRVRSTRTN